MLRQVTIEEKVDMMKHSAAVMGLALGIVLAFTVTEARAENNGTFSIDTFGTILEEAGKKAGNDKIKTANGPVPIFAGAAFQGDNSWHVNLTGTWGLTFGYDGGRGTVRTVTYPALITLQDSKFEFGFFGQPIIEHLAEGVFNAKNTQKAVKEFRKKYKDMPIETTFEDNRIGITTEYVFAAGDDEDDIRKRLTYLFKAANRVLLESQYGKKDAFYSLRNRTKGKLPRLTKSDFIFLMEAPADWEVDPREEWDPYEIEKEGVTEGAWDFTWGGRSMDVYNYGDRLVVQYTRDIAGPEEARSKLLTDMQKWVKKNKVDKSTVEARWDEGNPERLIVAMTVPVNGKTKGEDISKAYWKFMREKAKKANEQVDKLTKDW